MTTFLNNLRLILGGSTRGKTHLTFDVGVRIAVTQFHCAPKGVELPALVANAPASEF